MVARGDRVATPYSWSRPTATNARPVDPPDDRLPTGAVLLHDVTGKQAWPIEHEVLCGLGGCWSVDIHAVPLTSTDEGIA